MEEPTAPAAAFPLPSISEGELRAFHAAHFAPEAAEHFGTHFLGPVGDEHEEQGEEEEEEDDGLGYYPDGAKRTLTDEQIAMFRHSEIQALLREKRHLEESGPKNTGHYSLDANDNEDGEVEEEERAPTGWTSPEHSPRRPGSEALQPKSGRTKAKRNKRKSQRSRNNNVKPEPKPDLRKRTWDKVDQGLDSLHYGEADSGTATARGGMKRRKISYDDV